MPAQQTGPAAGWASADERLIPLQGSTGPGPATANSKKDPHCAVERLI